MKIVVWIKSHKNFVLGCLLILALLGFEIFNFSTTKFALDDLLGPLSFVGFRWSLILAIAFCGIDFAGIARIFAPKQGRDEPAEAYYLFGTWILAAALNATLTGWAVALQTEIPWMPIVIALLVWEVRVLIIGTFFVYGDRIFTK